jgi:ketosteroid isomerase-like protein
LIAYFHCQVYHFPSISYAHESMKRCPSCQSQYTDDTLAFCLQDGTRLIDAMPDDEPAVALKEIETVVTRRSDPDPQPSAVTKWRRQSEVTHISSLQPPRSKGKPAFAIAVVALLLFGFFGIIGLGTWTYLRNRGSGAANNANIQTNQLPATNSLPKPSTQVSPSPFASDKSTPNTTTPANVGAPTNAIANVPEEPDQIKREVSQRVIEWKSLAESHNLSAYMNCYADTIDYYTRHMVSRESVRNDKQRAFSMFSSININISNMNVSIDPAGQHATALFDKEWVFVGGRRNEGKVRSQVTFRKINGDWLITGERDIKLYYTR